MKANVSVLIPVHNYAAYIGEAIESVLKQTVPAMEIIVVDDGSTDGSGSIAASYPGVRCYTFPQQGVATARNRLVEYATGDYVAFLDADDLWLQDRLEKQMAYLAAHPTCEVVFCRYRNFTDLPEGELTQRQRRVLSVEIDQNLTGACIKRSLFDRCGLFDAKYQYGEDTEWLTRLKICGVDLSHCLEEVLYLRRIHANNLTLSHETQDQKAIMSLMADAIRNAQRRRKDP